jgi:oligopeptide/dipeptide ABC transporter ATP-binding protein
VEAVVLAVEAKKLSVGYEESDELLWAVREVSFEVREGEAFCIVGESGSGKSTVASAIAGILPPHGVTDGELRVGGRVVVKGNERDYEGVRGRLVTYVPQSPGASLNPYLEIGDQFYYVLSSLYGLSRREAVEKARAYLRMAGLEPDAVLDRYPHELSGGMQQRAAIALALSTGARILVADEPTSSLDAHLRLQIVELLKRLRAEAGLTLIFITHDMLLAGALSERVAVMYAGRLVELGPTREVLRKPLHPYTSMLIESVPVLGVKRPLKAYTGEPPSPGEPSGGCPFYERCPFRLEVCASENPPAKEVGESRRVACWLF